MGSIDLESLEFDEQGLIPSVVQDWRDGTVLMVGYMNRAAVEKTLATKSVYFWSRSRNQLWEKGETSGHRLVFKDLFVDCDLDTLLVKAEPVGPTCHTGERACFFSRIQLDGRISEEKTCESWGGLLELVYGTVSDRKKHPRTGSYVASLFAGGRDRILKKVVEEAGEVVLASKGDTRSEIIHEVSDLLFHLLVVLCEHDITLPEIYQELASRMGKSQLTSPPSSGNPR